MIVRIGSIAPIPCNFRGRGTTDNSKNEGHAGLPRTRRLITFARRRRIGQRRPPPGLQVEISTTCAAPPLNCVHRDGIPRNIAISVSESVWQRLRR
jgi:hypothetical protein